MPTRMSAALSNIASSDIMLFVGQLTPTYRIPFLMYVDGYEYKEIAADLGIPIGTVKSRIFNARLQLRTKLEFIR